jgi:hypothetical protein
MRTTVHVYNIHKIKFKWFSHNQSIVAYCDGGGGGGNGGFYASG